MLKRLAFVVRAAYLANLLCMLSPAAAQELQFYLLPGQAPPGAMTKVLKVWSGEDVLVALPPIATIPPEAVERAYGVVVPVHGEDIPTSRRQATELYRVVLELAKDDQGKLQEAVSRYCQPGTDLHITIDQIIVDHIVFLECGPFKPQVTFHDQTAAEEFAFRFTGRPIYFLRATPTSQKPDRPT